jgi:AcrR family transcriptional regulator
LLAHSERLITIYRHFRSKPDVFDALAGEAMRDEEELASIQKAASERLEGFVLALHKKGTASSWAEAQRGGWRCLTHSQPPSET